MTGNEYQTLASRTINHDLTVDDMINHSLFGMASEVGEILGLFQKNYQGHPIDFNHLEKELGDLMWFIAEFCTATDIWLDDVMTENIDKLLARYPDGFSEYRSTHREEGDV